MKKIELVEIMRWLLITPLNLNKTGKIEFLLIFDVFRNDVITNLIDVNFLNFHNEQKCMIIGLNLMYNFYLSRLKQNFSRGYKLLHVFWNTLYVMIQSKQTFTLY